MLVAPQALKMCFQLKIPFLLRKCTFIRIRAHQSISETFNTSLWRRKTKSASVNYFAFVVLATNKLCGTFPWQASVFLCCGTSSFKNGFSSQCQKDLFHILTNIPTFCPVYWLARRPKDRYRCLQWWRQPSHLSCFSMIHLNVLLLLHCWLN